MDGYQLGFVMLTIADMHRHCDHHGKCRQMTPESSTPWPSTAGTCLTSRAGWPPA